MSGLSQPEARHPCVCATSSCTRIGPADNHLKIGERLERHLGSQVVPFNWDERVLRPGETHQDLSDLGATTLSAADLGFRGVYAHLAEPRHRALVVISNDVVHSGLLGKNGRYHTFRSVREEAPSEAPS